MPRTPSAWSERKSSSRWYLRLSSSIQTRRDSYSSWFIPPQDGQWLHARAPKGVLYVLLKGVKEGWLNKKQAKESLGEMLEEGFCLSPTIIHKFHKALARP